MQNYQDAIPIMEDFRSNIKTKADFLNYSGAGALVIVGAGPAGLVSSLLLSRFHIPHRLVEQKTGPDDHPQAHFINRRSMEVLRELDRLDREVLAGSAQMEEWRRFVYCTNLADLPKRKDIEAGYKGSMLGVVDHFACSRADDHSPCQVTHFPQHEFVRLLSRRAMDSPYCHFIEGCRADVVETANKLAIRLTDLKTARQQVLPAPMVIGADGAHSAIRKGLGIEQVDQSGTLQHLINVHFFSRDLADRLRKTIPAMLYFVYSPAGVGVVVAHALSRGEFIAQIPFFPAFQPFYAFDEERCVQLIQRWVDRKITVQVKSIRPWSMRVALSDRFRSPHGRCFLVGDAAHQFTPAGGFGMNTGIQDAHNLIWKIALARKLEKAGNHHEADRLLGTYESERRPVAVNNARWSIENYEQTLAVPRALGLNPSLAHLLHRFLDRLPVPLPAKQKFFAATMAAGMKQIDWLRSDHFIARSRQRNLNTIFKNAKSQTLQLLFPGQDLGFIYTPAGSTGNIKHTAPVDPFEYEPSLRLGGRMPHFWIVSDTSEQISVLDLPRLMMDHDGHPHHIVMTIGAIDHILQKKAETQAAMANPATMVCIDTPSTPCNAVRFHFYGEKPIFLPPIVAVLIRPDGHIQWLDSP